MEITTKEGWREYVNAVYDRPAQLSRAELHKMSSSDRWVYNSARDRYAQAGAFVKTPQFRVFQRAARDRVHLNQHRLVGKLGLLLSGEPGQGKTTTLMQIGREHELRRRATGHPASAGIPVMYAAVPAQCSAKALLLELARFFGLPVGVRVTYAGLLDTVANALRRCSTELILLDDIHHMDLHYRGNIEASDMLKQLSERCGGTFIYAGIDVENTGLLSGSREGQIRKRFELHQAVGYEILTKQGQTDWGDLLLAVEDSLCLLEHPPQSILAAAKALHRLSNGEIGPLKDILQFAALHAIEDGTERLDIAAFQRTVEDRQLAAQSSRNR